MNCRQTFTALSCCFLLFCSCSKQPETVYVDAPAMRPSSIYNSEAVYWFGKTPHEHNKTLADSYLRKAEELKDQNLAKAIYNAKRAITLYPALENYEYLAGLLDKAGHFKELTDLYELIVRSSSIKINDKYEELFLFGKPTEQQLYNYLAASFLHYQDLDAYLIYQAEEEFGISRSTLKKRFLADKRIQLNPESESFKNLMLRFLSDPEIQEYIRSEENFRNYISSIKDTAAVFEIDEKGVQAFRYHSTESPEDEYEGYGFEISDFYVHYLEEKQQQPNIWLSFNINRRIRLNDSIQAVVYAIDTSETACPAEMRHVYHRLVTYRKNGSIIQSKIIAQQSGETLSTVRFEKDRFVVSAFKRTWRNPYQKSDFDNYLLKTEPAGKHTYKIGSDGRITEQTETAAGIEDAAGYRI